MIALDLRCKKIIKMNLNGFTQPLWVVNGFCFPDQPAQ